MATGQALLDRMELLDRELQLQSGEADVTRGLLALNTAQDMLEALMVRRPKLFGDTTGTITSSASTETTAFPSGVLRIDRIQFLDPGTSRPSGPDLENLHYVGAHANFESSIPGFLQLTQGVARPKAYWTNARNIYWAPLPDATHTFRWYGLSAASDITAGGTFAYPDYVMLPLAVMATKLFQIGLGDPVEALDALAEQIFEPTLDAMAGFIKDRPAGYDYRWVHDA